MTADARPPRRVQSSTSRDLQPRVATRAPSSGVVAEVVEDETTGPVPLSFDEVPGWAESQRRARHRMTARLDAIGQRIIEQGAKLDTLAVATADAKACADGARLSRRLLRVALVLVAIIPGAAFGAVSAFLAARDASARAAERATVERDRMRHDLDLLLAERRNNPSPWSRP